MATIWITRAEGLVACPVDAEGGAITDDSIEPSTAASHFFRLAPFHDGGRRRFALIVRAVGFTHINGSPLVGGIRVLQHKDEISVGSESLFFSAEATPVVEVYRPDDSPKRPRCAICRAAIQDAQHVVRCPGCARLYHQIAAVNGKAEKHCWTYSPTCRFCEHPTSLSGELSWRPDVGQLCNHPD